MVEVVTLYGVTVYEVIGLPFEAGAVNLTFAEASPAVAVTPVGAPGAAGIFIVGDGDEAGLCAPDADAATVNL